MWKLGIVFFIASILTIIYVIRTIRKCKLNIDDSIIWIVWGILILIISIFPQLPAFVSSKLGFISTSNFIFSLFIFFLYIVTFLQAIKISKLEEKNKDLIQKLSIEEYEKKQKNNRT